MGVDTSPPFKAQVDKIKGMSDDQLIGVIHGMGPGNISGHQLELQRRFTDRLVGAIGAGKVAAWAMVAVTLLLVIVTGVLAVATWRLGG